MATIPNIAHFVFGLQEQLQPFHLLHYLAIESCRKIMRPDTIYLHYHHLPFGVFWDELRPYLTLKQVDLANEVVYADYDDELVPKQYRYAHHADFVRLDALIEYGGIYADIDTIFLRPFPKELFDKPFVIGREQNVVDEITGILKPSLCNALLMSQPESHYAKTWRDRMGVAINGTWSNHSGFLAQAISEELPEHVHVEPETSFFGIPFTPVGLRNLLEGGPIEISQGYSIHLWEHVWWNAERTDFTKRHAGELTLKYFRESDAPISKIVKPFLPTIDVDDVAASLN